MTRPALSSSDSRLRLRLLPPPPGLHRGGRSLLGNLARQLVELGVRVEAGDLRELVPPLLPGLRVVLGRGQLLPGEPLRLRELADLDSLLGPQGPRRRRVRDADDLNQRFLLVLLPLLLGAARRLVQRLLD